MNSNCSSHHDEVADVGGAGSLTAHVHIGMPKTGSTSIQESLYKLELGRARYIPFAGSNHTPLFINLFERSPWRQRLNSLSGVTRQDAEENRARLSKQMASYLDDARNDPNIDAVIFSAERMGMPGKVDKAAIQAFKDFFADYCNCFRVYGYVRPLQSFLPSEFQQILKLGATRTLTPTELYPRYRERLEKHDEVFGPEVVLLRPYHRDLLNRGDVVSDIADQMGLHLEHAKQIRANDGMSLEVTALLFAMAKGGPLIAKVANDLLRNDRIQHRLRRDGDQKLEFAHSLINPLFDQFHEDLDWVGKRVGGIVTKLEPCTGNAVSSENDLLDIAAAEIDRLADVEPGDPSIDPDGETLRKWVEDGLKQH